VSGGDWLGDCPGSGDGTGVIWNPSSSLSKYDSRRVATDARRVSIEGRVPSPAIPSSLPLAPFFLLVAFFVARQVEMMNLVHAFLIRRHNEMVSSAVLTLLKSTSLWTGALLSSLSRTVLRQSSMPSLTAVTTMMTISGTALSAGLEAPNMENICETC
jgi:hypothetical protein